MTLRMDTLRLLIEMEETLPTGSPKPTELAELLVAGIGLRNGFSMLQLTAILPDLSVLRFRLSFSRALADPALSIWYFDQLEFFNERFLQLMQGCDVKPLARFPTAASFLSQGSRQKRTYDMPAMPVAGVY